MIDPSRAWENRYHRIWNYDDAVQVTHPQDCYPGNCSFIAYKKDGKVIREEQTGEYPPVDPETPDWNPRGCNKGCLYSDVTYGDERIRQPMKQTGPRGSGQWEPISWEEAYREIADAILDAVQENPQSLVLEPPVEGGTFQAMSSMLLFMNLLGGTVLDEVAEISDFSPGLYTTLGKFHVASTVDEWFKSELNLIWHMNPVYTRIPSYHFLTENRYSGGKLVTISPDYSPSCVHADQFVPVNPASDAALALGMCKVILDQDLESRDFIREQTDLPLLVREDNGRFLRQSDLEENGKDDLFYVWDRREGLTEAPQENLHDISEQVSVFADQTVETPSGSVKVTSVANRLKQKLAEEYSLDRVREITGVHPRVIRELAREVAQKKTNILLGFNTAKTFHGDLIERAMSLLLALTGNWGKPGTGIRSWNVVSEPGMPFGGGGDGFKDLAKMAPGDPKSEEELTIKSNMIQAAFGFPTVPPVFFWYYHCGYDEVWEAVDEENLGLPRSIGDYMKEALQEDWWEKLDRPQEDVSPNVLVAMGNNTLRRTRGGTRTFLQTLWPKLETVVTVDFRWSTTALYSDIVLPAAFFYEKEQFHQLTSSENRFWSYTNQAIEPVHESRSEWTMIRQLADAICARAEERGIDSIRVDHGVTSDTFEQVVGRKLELPEELQPLLGKERKIQDLREFITQDGRYDESGLETAMRDVMKICRDEGLFGEEESLESIRERGFVKYEGLGDSAEGANMATDVEPDETVTALKNHVEEGQPYPTLTGRAQFYIDHEWYREANEHLPVHKNPPNQGGEYPFRMDSGHQRWSIHASTVTNEQMAQTHRGEPFVFVNEADAKEKNIADGDTVEIYNDYGTFRVQAKLSALPERGQLIIYHAWDPHQFEDWKSYDHVIPGLIKPLHLVGNYGHLQYWISNWQPQQIDRHINVGVRPV